MAGQNDDLHLRIGLLDGAQDFKAIDAGHPQVKDNDVRRIGLDLFEAILAVIGHGGIKAAQEEPVLQRVHKLDFVIDKQDFNGFLRHNDSLE